jgi:hypothetical protein
MLFICSFSLISVLSVWVLISIIFNANGSVCQMGGGSNSQGTDNSHAAGVSFPIILFS